MIQQDTIELKDDNNNALRAIIFAIITINIAYKLGLNIIYTTE